MRFCKATEGFEVWGSVKPLNGFELRVDLRLFYVVKGRMRSQLENQTLQNTLTSLTSRPNFAILTSKLEGVVVRNVVKQLEGLRVGGLQSN